VILGTSWFFASTMDSLKVYFLSMLAAGAVLLSLQVRADVWTGRAQNILGPITPCSIPPKEVPQFTELRVASEFSHLSCKEYISNESAQYVFRLTSTSESEYIRLIAQQDQQFVSTNDYRRGAETVLINCTQKHIAVLQNSIPISESWCTGQSLPR
jgi:hypothetical protein